MARIAYFSNQFASRSGHGVARYSRELFSAMASIDHGHQIIPLASWSDRTKEELQELRNETGLRLSPLGRLGTAAAWTYLNTPRIEQIFKGKWDLVHDLSLGYPMATHRKRIVSIHDLGVLTHPQYFSNNSDRLTLRTLKQAVFRGDHLLCVSNSTAAEVKALARDTWGVTVDDHLTVIHEGVNTERFGEKASTSPHPKPYILAVGKISPRKNVLGILDAYRMIEGQEEVDLVLVGGDGWDHEQVHRYLDSGRLNERVHLKGYVSDDELAAYYTHAELFVYPSYYEGFGLTVLEAMAAGTPVLSSDRSSIPEVAGNAAVLVDPSDHELIAEGMSRILNDSEFARSLIQAGKERVARFSWETCARKTLDLYESI